MAYVLDSDVFIQAHRQHYPMDVVPGFWEALLNLAAEGHVVSIEEVYLELSNGNDMLAEWATAHHDDLFVPNDDEDTQATFADVAAAVDGRLPPYVQAAKDVFLSGADPWLVAFSRAHDHTLVTQEASAPLSLSSVKIPDACALVGVECIRTLDMLRTLGVRLVQG